jgi:rubredoxin
MTHPETPFKTLEKHFSPPNCTFSHFIRKFSASKRYATNFFNEIKDLCRPLKIEFEIKFVQN